MLYLVFVAATIGAIALATIRFVKLSKSIVGNDQSIDENES